MPKIGAHVSASISLDLSLTRAKAIGANCSQFFISPPQQWIQTNHGAAEIGQYLTKLREDNISPNFIHGTYLINLAADDSQHLEKSISWLVYALDMADKLGVDGVIFHLGSHKGKGFSEVLNQIVKAVKKILQQSPPKPLLVLENAAGAGGAIGSFSELGAIIKGVDNPRLKICLDTQHAFASGHDFRTPVGLKKMIEEFEKEIGWDKLVALHCNDSKVELGSNRDRHENIGDGFIGRDAFSLLLNHPKFESLSFILEVPGFGGAGPDAENISILKTLLNDS